AQGFATPAWLTQPSDNRIVTTIRGVAIERGTRTPVPLASIRVYDEVTNLIGTGGTTDAQGRFELALPQGHYRLFVSRADFENDVSLSSGQDVTLDKSQQTELNVELPLTRGAVIAGRVLQVSGQPLVGAMIRVYRNQSVSGHVRPVIVPTDGAKSTTD